MNHLALVAVLGVSGFLAGCNSGVSTIEGLGGQAIQSVSPSVDDGDARDGLGVSIARPTAATDSDADTAKRLDWKLGQLCTSGYDGSPPVAKAAEGDQQLVTQEATCRRYELSLFDVASLFDGSLLAGVLGTDE